MSGVQPSVNQIVRDTADAFIASGLADHGFSYINIDDGWEGMRCDKGRIRGNQKFPDMKALAEYIHSYGLKLGIYSSPGIKTCAGYEGSLGHEQQDAESFAEWRIDYLKYDWCSYKARLPHIRWPHLDREDHLFFQYIFPREELKKPYQLMRKALDQVDRDIVYSISPKKLKGVNNVAHWGIVITMRVGFSGLINPALDGNYDVIFGSLICAVGILFYYLGFRSTMEM